MLNIFAEMMKNVGIKGEVEEKAFYGEADFNNDDVCELISKISEVAVDVEDNEDGVVLKFKHFRIYLNVVNA